MSKSFEELAKEIGELVTSKNRKYGNSFGKTAAFFKILFPNGIRPDQYEDLGCFFRMFDKMVRKATSAEDEDESPYRDLAGYSILGLKKDLDKAEEKLKVEPCRCIAPANCFCPLEAKELKSVHERLAEELALVRDYPTTRPGGFLPGTPNRDPFDDIVYKKA